MADEPKDAIALVDAAPEVPAEPVATTESPLEGAVKEIPEGEETGSPEPAAPAPVATPKTPEPVAVSPAAPTPVATAFDFTQHQQAGQRRYQALQQHRQRFTLENETAKTTDMQALADFEKQLGSRGDLPEETINELVGQKKELQAQARKNTQDQWNAFFQREEFALQAHAKTYIAQKLSAAHGMPVADLLAFDHPDVMEAKAENYKLQQKNAALEKENAKLKKAQVPAGQRLASTGAGPGAAGLSDKSYKELLQSGKTLPDAADIDRLTAKYLKG